MYICMHVCFCMYVVVLFFSAKHFWHKNITQNKIRRTLHREHYSFDIIKNIIETKSGEMFAGNILFGFYFLFAHMHYKNHPRIISSQKKSTRSNYRPCTPRKQTHFSSYFDKDKFHFLLKKYPSKCVHLKGYQGLVWKCHCW